jgi:hypothetical protein
MFVGLDVHKNYLQAAVVDGRGTLPKEGRIPNRIDEIRMFFEAHLRSQGIQVSHRSIYLILKCNNLITKSYKPRKQRSYIRFARQHPDSLWQTDIKYYGTRCCVA